MRDWERGRERESNCVCLYVYACVCGEIKCLSVSFLHRSLNLNVRCTVMSTKLHFAYWSKNIYWFPNSSLFLKGHSKTYVGISWYPSLFLIHVAFYFQKLLISVFFNYEMNKAQNGLKYMILESILPIFVFWFFLLLSLSVCHITN